MENRKRKTGLGGNSEPAWPMPASFQFHFSNFGCCRASLEKAPENHWVLLRSLVSGCGKLWLRLNSKCLHELLQKRSRGARCSSCDLRISSGPTNYSSYSRIRYKAWCQRNRNCGWSCTVVRALTWSVALHVRGFWSWLLVGASQTCKARNPTCDQLNRPSDFIVPGFVRR